MLGSNLRGSRYWTWDFARANLSKYSLGAYELNKYAPLWPLGGEDQESRDRLLLSAYEASVNPLGYGAFLENLGIHLGRVAGNISELDDFESADYSAVEADSGLIEHLQKVGSIIERLEDTPKFGTLPQRVASAQGPQVLFDERGKLLAKSASSNELGELESQPYQSLLEHLFPDDAINLRHMLKSIANGEHPAPIVVRGDDLHLIARCVFPEVRLAPSLLVESLRVAWSDGLVEALRKSFSLTNAELGVLEKLSNGDTVASIASATGRKEGTVRNQVKSLLSKTGVNGQANLIRLVVMLAGAIPAAKTKGDPPTLSQGDIKILALGEDRTMEVRVLGPKTGRALVFVHGQLYGTEMPGEVLDFLDRNNLRLICPSRPGFGSSDPVPGNIEIEPSRLADDYSIVMDHFGLDETVLVANITGSLYAYAIAARLSGRVKGIVCAGGVVPMKEARQYVDAAPRQRIVAYLGRFAPALLPPLLQAGISQIKEGGELAFLEGLYQENTRDRLVLNDPEKQDLLERSVHFGISQGYHGVYNDTFHLVRDWTPWVSAVESKRIRSIHVHGSDDPAVRIESVRSFATRHPNVEIREISGSGQLVFFDQPLRVFGSALEILDQ